MNGMADMNALLFDLDHLESVDLFILDTLRQDAQPVPFYKNQIVLSIGAGLGILILLALLGLLLQAIR